MKVDESAELPPTGREKLVDAALFLFARDGFDATSLRAVADEAGLSWGLIRFYFGSKEGLRDAVEERVVDGFMQRVRAGSAAKTPEELAVTIEREAEGLGGVVRYLRRAIVEERPAAMELLRTLLARHEQTVQHSAAGPLVQDAVGYLVNQIGYLVLAPQIEALTGRDVFSAYELKRRNVQRARLHELVELGIKAEGAKRKRT